MNSKSKSFIVETKSENCTCTLQASKIIEEISGDKLNESSIRAAISEISKKKMDKYL